MEDAILIKCYGDYKFLFIFGSKHSRFKQKHDKDTVNAGIIYNWYNARGGTSCGCGTQIYDRDYVIKANILYKYRT